jgi:hypothetical protein
MTFEWGIWTGKRRWMASEADMVVSHVTVKTDRLPNACISIFGLSVCFLNVVIPAVRNQHPEYQV